MLVGHGRDVPAPAEDVLEIEDAAGEEAGPTSGIITIRLFQPERAPRITALDLLPDIVQEDRNFVWVDLSGYNRRDLERVAGLLHLHRAGIHTTLAAWKRPRLDLYGDHFLVSATIPHLDAAAYRLHAHELDLFVGRNVLVSAHKNPLPFADRVLVRAEHSPELLPYDSAFMLYIILDELLAYYESMYEQVQEQIEAMEERALTDISDAFLRDLLHFKRYAFALSQLAEQHREVFAAFLRPDFQHVSGDDIDIYFRDLEARLTRLIDMLHGARDAVNGAFDLYVSRVSHHTNNVIRVLTIVSTTLLPVSVILAFFGTNNIQGTILAQPGGFIIMMCSVVLVTAIVLLGFHRKGWLS